MLQVLGSTVNSARASAAQVIAKIAKVELPRGQWPTLIDALLASAMNPVSELAKQATLNTLGFICEELVSSYRFFCFRKRPFQFI